MIIWLLPDHASYAWPLICGAAHFLISGLSSRSGVLNLCQLGLSMQSIHTLLNPEYAWKIMLKGIISQNVFQLLAFYSQKEINLPLLGRYIRIRFSAKFYWNKSLINTKIAKCQNEFFALEKCASRLRSILINFGWEIILRNEIKWRHFSTFSEWSEWLI